MGLPAAALWTVGTLVLLTRAASMEDGDLPALSGPCLVTLAPEGPCELDKDECPFVFNLPQMTINLPKKLMELERLVEELQLLKDNVDELRRMCKDCAVSQSERECGGEAEHETSKHSKDGVWTNGNPESKNADKTIWERDRENTKKVLSEDGKSLEVEQVAAAGKNVRITAGKKLDRKQIDGREKGILDKLLKRVGNASQSQKNKTIGKSEILRDRVIDRKKQIEAVDGGEKISEEFERGGWRVETVLNEKNTLGKNDDMKIDHQIPISSSKAEQEDMLKKKEEKTQSRDSENTDASDHRIWPDKHHEVDHEKIEKNYSNINKSEEEPIDSHGPDVWRDKSQVDKNQMQTRRYGDGIEERGKTRISNQKEKNTQSGRHVWPDETMESGSAERIKLSGEEGGDRGQDPGEIDGNDKKAKQAEWEKMNSQQPSQSNPNENSNIDELTKVEKTSSTLRKLANNRERKTSHEPPSQTSKNVTDTKPSSVEVQTAKNTTKASSHTTSNSRFTAKQKTNSGTPSQAEREKPIKNIARELKRPAQKNGEVKNSRVMEGTDLGSLSQPSVINSGFIDLEQAFTLTSPPAFTASHSTTDVKPGHGKSVQNNEMGGSKEHLRTDAESVGDEDYKMESAEENFENEYDQMERTVWQSKKEWNMAPVVESGQRNPTKTESAIGLDATSSPAIVSHITTDAKQGYQKTNDQRPFQSSQHENSQHSNIDELDKIEKTASTILELDTNRDVVQGERKTTYKPPSQTIQNEKITEYSSVDVQSAKNTSQLITKVSSVSDKATITTSNSGFTTNLRQQKTTSGPTSQSNQDEKDSNTLYSNLNEQLTKVLIESGKTVYIDTTSASPTASKSHFAIDLDQGRRQIGEELPSKNNYNKMDIKTEGSNVYTHLTKNATQPTKDSTSSAATESKSHPTTTNVKQGQQKPPSQSHQDEKDSKGLSLDAKLAKATSQPKTNALDEDAIISTPNSHVTTNLEEGTPKIAKRPTSQSNQDKRQSEGSGFDAQSAKATSQPKTSALDEEAKISAPNSHVTTNLEKGNQKIAKRPTSQSNRNEKDSEHSSLDTQSVKATSKIKTSPQDEDATISTTNSHATTNVKRGNQKLAQRPTSQSNQDKKQSEGSGLDAQSAKATSQPKTSALDEDATISTTNSQVTTNLEKGNQKIAKRPSSQSNQDEKDSEGLSLDSQLAKATSQPKTSALDEDATISTTNSHVTTNLEEGPPKIAKWPTSQRNQDEKDSEDLWTKATSHSKTSALAEVVTISTPTVSKSQFTTDVKKEDGKLTNRPKSQSNQEETVIDSMHSGHDANSIPSQATNVISEVTTSSTPTDKQKSPYRPSGKENEKDSNSEQSHFDSQLAKVRSQPTRSAFTEDISSTTASTTTLRHRASFKDEVPSTTYTSHQISPTTTSPPTADKRLTAKMNMSKKTTQDQGPKAKVGMKPEANQKTKNAKNDRKPDRASLFDTEAKGDQRQKPVTRPKVTPGKAPQPVQIPKSNQSAQSHTIQVRGNVTDNRLPSAVPVQKSPGQTPTLLPRLMDVNVTSMTDEGHNASSTHGDRHSEADEQEKTNEGANNERPKQFIKKIGQNATGSVTQNQRNQFNGTKDRLPGQSIPKNPKLNPKDPKINQKTKPAQMPKVKPVHPKMEAGQITKVKPKLEQAPKAKIPKPIADSKNSSKVPPGQKTPTKPLKPKAIPASKTKLPLKPKSKESTDMVPTSGPIKLTTERATEFKSTTFNAKTTPDLEALDNNKVLEGSTLSTNSRIIDNGGSQTTSQAPLIALTTLANKVIQASTTLSSNRDSSQQEKVQATNQDRITIPSSAPRVRSLFRSTTPGPKAPAAEATTPSARELRVKINQVAAFLNKSNTHPHGRSLGLDKQTEKTDRENPAIKPVTILTRDCSDHMLRGHSKSGVYLVRPDPSIGSFRVFCELEVDGGGWTVLQRRQDGSVSFNRSWAEYREGFGQLDGGEFWLGNTYTHLLTRDRPMELRVELEDFEGVQEYAQYQLFKVASERLRYKLSVDGYSGTAGNALSFSSSYDHNNRAFTTPDRDNDRYPSGNCGAYYSSGWWFDACMAANLNGRYYTGRYKGVRDGIYWGTWHNISSEYYPTNERLSFKTVRMMIRPQGFKP